MLKLTRSYCFIRRWICFLAATLLIQATVLGQDPRVTFKRFGADEGIAVATVFDIIQGDAGLLWMTTIDGLYKYDGLRFTAYKHLLDDSSSISENLTHSLCKARDGTIWVGTYNGGLNKFDPLTGKFKSYMPKADDPSSLSHNRVWTLVEDNEGILWVGTVNGLNRFDPKVEIFTHFFNNPSDPRSIVGNTILTSFIDSKDNIWIGTSQGLSKIVAEEEGHKIQNFRNLADHPNSLSNNIIFNIYEDKEGGIWVGTSNGLNKFHNKTDTNYFDVYKFYSGRSNVMINGEDASTTNKVYSYLNNYGNNSVRAIYQDKHNYFWLGTDNGIVVFSTEHSGHKRYMNDPYDISSLSNDLVTCFYQDHSENLWIGTMAGGMNKVDLKPQKFELVQTEHGNYFNLSSNNIRSFIEDESGSLWVGTMSGGLNVSDPRTGKFTRIEKTAASGGDSFNPDNVWVIKSDKQNNKWIGTSKGLYFCDATSKKFILYSHDPENPSSLSENTVRDIFFDSREVMWVGTERGLNRFDPKTESFVSYVHDKNSNSMSNNTVWVISEYPRGVMWIGTDRGLNRLRVKDVEEGNPVFVHYIPEAGNKNSISDPVVKSIYPAPDGILWIGTGNGLNAFDPIEEVFTRYNEKDGLQNSYVYSVLSDNSGGIWMSTNGGISKYTPETKQFRNFSRSDGLQNNEFNTGAYYKGNSGDLYFGGPNGFNKFDPQRITYNPYPPRVIITSIKVMGVELEAGRVPYDLKEIRVDYDENVISFDFAALDYTHPELNSYAYMLVGFDQDWIYSEERHFASYTNLDPGEYEFQVKASNNDGLWNSEKVILKIEIVPPFWKTIWFQLFVAIGVIASIIFFVLFRERQLIQQREILEEQVAERTAELSEKNREVEEQNKIIEKKNQDITGSIRYARRIQESVLPGLESITDLIPNSFVLFKPKDIVSGDFYWFARHGDLVLVAAVDCTGHGVPGAFMSIIGIELLKEIVLNRNVTEPADILMQMHEGIISALHKEEQDSVTADGMDMAICTFNEKSGQLQFSGARRPVIVVKDGSLNVYKGDKLGIGLRTEAKRSYETLTLDLSKDDSFYIFTDGYCDQFGGGENEKFMYDRFSELLSNVSTLDATDQMKNLESEFMNWKGEEPQVDDILVIGIKV